MVMLQIFALLALCVSLALILAMCRTFWSGRSAYALPPAGWPDIDAKDLSVFARSGQINAPVDRSARPKPRRFRDFHETQDFVIGLLGAGPIATPSIALQLSERDGPDWTDVMVDGHVVGYVPTQALVAGSRGGVHA